MTHYTIVYGPGPAEDARAIRDAIEYLGRDRWRKSLGTYLEECGNIRDYSPSAQRQIVRTVRFVCGMAGISGRPVRAILRGLFAQGK